MEGPSVGERVRVAATVLLWRRAPDLEVYLVERSLQTRFFPGYHAFPGGVVDTADGEGPLGRARAAAREVEEETRVRLHEADLVEAATLLTPPFGPLRYDTTFFVAQLPEGQEPEVDGAELVSGRWWRPADALARWERDAMPIPPPTLAFLRTLVRTGDPLATAKDTRATNGRPHHERFVIEMHPGVFVLPLRAPTLPPATTQNCWILPGDGTLLVIDPGTPRQEEWVALTHTIAQFAEGREVVVALTHHHGDHVGAVPELRRRFAARVLAHPATQDRLPPGFVDEAIDEGHVFDLGERHGRRWRVRALHTPGHAPGHLAFRDERWGAILAGDLVSGVSTILIDPGEGDMAAYMTSLDRCVSLKPPVVLPGHGPALPGGAFAKTLAHRKEREAKALAALGAAPATLAQLVSIVYDDTPREAWNLAERSLASILRKLETEGKARRSGDAWARGA